jgi:hypothetical protein
MSLTGEIIIDKENVDIMSLRSIDRPRPYNPHIKIDPDNHELNKDAFTTIDRSGFLQSSDYQLEDLKADPTLHQHILGIVGNQHIAVANPKPCSYTTNDAFFNLAGIASGEGSQQTQTKTEGNQQIIYNLCEEALPTTDYCKDTDAYV